MTLRHTPLAARICRRRFRRLRFKSLKTKHGRWTISIPAFLVSELRTHLIKVQERRLLMGMGGATGDDLLFPRWDVKFVRHIG
jgi:hypothetical protein